MKRSIIFTLSLVGLIGAFSCSVEHELDEEEITKISFSIDRARFEDENPLTKTQFGLSGSNNETTLWAVNDTVGIYPNAGAQVYFVTTAGGVPTVSFDGGGWAFKSNMDYYSYCPFIGDFYLDKTAIPLNYQAQKQVGKTGINTPTVSNFLYTDKTNSSAGTLNFQYHYLNTFMRFKLSGLPAGEYIRFAVKAPTPVFVKKGKFDLTATNPSVVGVEYTDMLYVNLEDFTVAANEEVRVYLFAAPMDLTNGGSGTQLKVSIWNKDKKEYTCNKTSNKTLNVGVFNGYTCPTSGDSWTEVNQSVGFDFDDWGDGGSIGGNAD